MFVLQFECPHVSNLRNIISNIEETKACLHLIKSHFTCKNVLLTIFFISLVHVISNIYKIKAAGTHHEKCSQKKIQNKTKKHLSIHFLFLNLPVSRKHVREVMHIRFPVPRLFLLTHDLWVHPCFHKWNDALL